MRQVTQVKRPRKGAPPSKKRGAVDGERWKRKARNTEAESKGKQESTKALGETTKQARMLRGLANRRKKSKRLVDIDTGGANLRPTSNDGGAVKGKGGRK